MKHIRILSLILIAGLLLTVVFPALALSNAEKEQMYSDALDALEGYLEDFGDPDIAVLNGVIDRFEELGGYQQSQCLRYYAQVLLKIENGEFDSQMSLYLRMMDKAAFASYIDEELSDSPIRPVAELQAYADARKAESEGDIASAIRLYEQAGIFYDAMSRMESLQGDTWAEQYELGMAALLEDDLPGAYGFFNGIRGYRDSDDLCVAIIDMLGYDPLHEHVWQDATCETPKICTLCGVTEGTALGHKWDNGTVTAPATCVSDGIMTYTCAACGATKTGSTPKDKANHAGGTVTGNKFDATCGSNGYTGDTYCNGCGSLIMSGSTISATGNHDWQDATYDAPKTCRVCGKTEGEPLPRVKVGNYITYGHYPQTASGTDNTPIEWLVLDVQGNKALLISRYGLDCQPYNSRYTSVTWETCSLRTWLNYTFLNKAFSKAEQGAILTTSVHNSKSQCYSGYSTNGGNNTQDKIFLLSYAEANKYFGVTREYHDNTKSRVAPTAYSIAQGAYTYSIIKTADGSASGYWWLRSPGSSASSAAYVDNNGSLGGVSSVSCDNGVVRPAFWLIYQASNIY